MWIVFAFLSALFAGVTSILAKCGGVTCRYRYRNAGYADIRKGEELGRNTFNEKRGYQNMCKNLAYAFDDPCLTDEINTFSDKNRELMEALSKKYDFERYFSHFIDDDDKYAYCIKADNQIVGFPTGLNIPSLTAPYLIYIDMLAVMPQHQKHGYGTKLLQYF